MNSNDQLVINDSGWRRPERSFNDVPNEVYSPRRCNKIESRKKMTIVPYDAANKKIKRDRSCKGSKSNPSIEELGIQLREVEEEEEEEEYDEVEIKKIQDDFEKGHVVYGKGEAFKSILQQYDRCDGIQGVISSHAVDEISISPKKLYDVDKDYERGDLLGKGGVGTVFLVTDKVSGKKFVQKQIKKANFAIKEVEVLLSLKHENITEFYGLIIDDEYISVFMSFAGTSLESLVFKHQRKFTEEEVIFFSIQALSALAYMQRYRMIHMDIKPQNVCIQENCHLSLTDFGSSLTPQQPLAFSGLTPEYMSPELCQLCLNVRLYQEGKPCCYNINRTELNGKNDVYAWACTMFYALSGKHAALKFYNPQNFQQSRFQFVYLVAQKPHLMSMHAAPDTITADLRSVIALFLHGNVKDRPDAEQAKQRLEELQQRRHEQTSYQLLESISIKLKLKEKIINNMGADIPEDKPTVHRAEVEPSKPTENIPNFESLF